MVNVAVAGEKPVRVTAEGETVQVVPAGQMVATIRLTVPMKSFSGVIVMVEVPPCPGAAMLIDDGLTVAVKSPTFK
jgi:hypothetical protein